jgi:hypothetical protein
MERSIRASCEAENINLPPVSGLGSAIVAIEQRTALETTRGQIDGFLSQLPFKCYLLEVASAGD